jgi:hypothetical protein
VAWLEGVWKIAVGVAGLGAVAALFLWAVYAKWLDVAGTTFAKLNQKQTYNLFRLFLILSFVFALLALVAYVVAESRKANVADLRHQIEVTQK